METIKKQPLLSGVLILFLAAMVFANVGGSMYDGLLPLYLKDLDADITQIGLFFTLAQIVPLFLQILGGWVSDSLGRLRAIAIGSVFGVLGYIPLVLADKWQWLLLATAIGAIARSLVGPSFDAFIAEHSSEQNRGRVYGISQAIFMIVMVVGPPLGGWLTGAYGFKLMLLVAGAFYFIATVMRLSMAREAVKGEKANGEHKKLSFNDLKSNLGSMIGLLLSGGLITWMLITDGLRDVSFQFSGNLFPVYMQESGGLNYQQIGWVTSMFGVFMMLSTIPGGWLSDKAGERVSIALGMVLLSLALFILVNIPQGVEYQWLFFVGWAVAGLGAGISGPAYQSLISKAVPQKLRGLAFGLFSTSLGVFSLPAPWIGAQLWDRIGPKAPFTITAIVILLSVIPIWLKFKLPDSAEPVDADKPIDESVPIAAG
ncbi:MAG: MFS transporter [Anaerolineales bacterium]|jgi:MFS family permease|uniref:MFS transporter n=1 Tax=Candidatus Villigracilis vicinus TaxID=3140679 RepID=UPI003135674D|nr:MFS transporter [Anaerolineales bacterium]MBK9780567.1 MFS transporter [Anaerolineales bacterium]